MKLKHRTIQQIVEDQVQIWLRLQPKEEKEQVIVPVITISRDPGSGGNILGQKLADSLGFTLFHQEVIQKLAESSKVSTQLLETLDERGLSTLEDWINSLVDRRHLWPDQYLRHLLKVIGTLGKHGRAVLIGRGANFLLPPENRFAIRVIAHRDIRIANVAAEFGLSTEEATRRILRTESTRKAFIRKYFNADIEEPVSYDLIVNTGTLKMDAAVEGVKAAFEEWRQDKP
jgi:cytidylate kinase